MTGSISKPESTTPRRWFEQGPLTSLRDEMDDLFSSFFGAPGAARGSDVAVPSIDVAETDDAFEIKTDLPGIKSEDVNIEIRDNHLTISGSTSEEKKTEVGEGRKYHRLERRTGSFSRSIRLPCDVEEDNVDAELKDGVLTISLPKAQQAKSKKISIKG